MELERDICVFRRVGGRLFQVDLVKRKLFGTLAGDILVVNRVDVQVEACD